MADEILRRYPAPVIPPSPSAQIPTLNKRFQVRRISHLSDPEPPSVAAGEAPPTISATPPSFSTLEPLVPRAHSDTRSASASRFKIQRKPLNLDFTANDVMLAQGPCPAKPPPDIANDDLLFF
jgi:hypothetical protein